MKNVLVFTMSKKITFFPSLAVKIAFGLKKQNQFQR